MTKSPTWVRIVTKMTGDSAFTTLATKTTALGTAVTAYSRRQRRLTWPPRQTSTKNAPSSPTPAPPPKKPRATWPPAPKRSPPTPPPSKAAAGKCRPTRAPVGQLPQPANLVATGGDLEGTVDLSWDALRRGVQTYIAQQATSPSGPWTQCYVGKASSCTVTGLTSGTQYWFQVCAIGAAGPSAWSDPATKRAT